MTIRKAILVISIIFGFISSGTVAASAASNATEQINNYDVEIVIDKDASINISERIDYDFGTNQRHGIYRDIPIKYKARGGNFNLRISGIDVRDDNGQMYEFTKEQKGKDLRLKIGDPDVFITGQKTYVISYKIKRAINYFDKHDELYWNAIGTGWNVSILKSRATVILPQEFSKTELQKECFAGFQGSQEKCSGSRYLRDDDELIKKIRFTQEALNPYEGLTVVVGFPKDVVHKPTAIESFIETLKDNYALFLPLITFIVLFVYWFKRGREPKGRGVVVTQFEAPDNLTPAEIGTIVDGYAQNRDISAEIINLAVKGYLKITRLEKKDYLLERLKTEGDLPNEFEKKLIKGLFDTGRTVKLSSLKNSFYKDLEIIKKEIYDSVTKKGYFINNPNAVRMKFRIIAAVGAIALSAFAIYEESILLLLSSLLSGAIVFIFSFFMPARTKKGSITRELILGLKQYLSVAEKERLKFHNAPEKNPEQFEKLLSYAIALRVERQWAGQFENIYKEPPSWYSDSWGRGFSTSIFVSDINRFSTSSNTILSSKPSSSSSGGSGFSGGGSGGGGGGGGGGSW